MLLRLLEKSYAKPAILDIKVLKQELKYFSILNKNIKENKKHKLKKKLLNISFNFTFSTFIELTLNYYCVETDRKIR